MSITLFLSLTQLFCLLYQALLKFWRPFRDYSWRRRCFCSFHFWAVQSWLGWLIQSTGRCRWLPPFPDADEPLLRCRLGPVQTESVASPQSRISDQIDVSPFRIRTLQSVDHICTLTEACCSGAAPTGHLIESEEIDRAGSARDQSLGCISTVDDVASSFPVAWTAQFLILRWSTRWWRGQRTLWLAKKRRI